MGLTFTTEDQPDLTLPEDTIFRAQLEEIKPKEISWPDKQNPGQTKTATLLQWWWVIKGAPDEKYIGRKIKGECDAKLTNHPGNRFHNWAETLLGREIPAGVGVDTDDLVGLSADISVRHEPDKKDPGKSYERLDEVLPITGGFDRDTEPPF